MILHIPAVAHAAGLDRPTVDDWSRANRDVPRLADIMPNGPHGYATVQAFLAGGVPEVMLHLRDLGLARTLGQDRFRTLDRRGPGLVGSE